LRTCVCAICDCYPNMINRMINARLIQMSGICNMNLTSPYNRVSKRLPTVCGASAPGFSQPNCLKKRSLIMATALVKSMELMISAYSVNAIVYADNEPEEVRLSLIQSGDTSASANVT